jgi:hypothetical protein
MRDLAAAVIALVLLFVAASLGTTLTMYRKRRRLARESEQAAGRTIIVELPVDDRLVLVTEDAFAFHYGAEAIEKDAIAAVRVLINGSPIAAYVSTRHATDVPRQATSFEDRPEGIARDRWDVAVETLHGTTLIECGAIRERVSQELARTVFDAIRDDVERRDRLTTPSRAGRRDG